MQNNYCSNSINMLFWARSVWFVCILQIAYLANVDYLGGGGGEDYLVVIFYNILMSPLYEVSNSSTSYHVMPSSVYEENRR